MEKFGNRENCARATLFKQLSRQVSFKSGQRRINFSAGPLINPFRAFPLYFSLLSLTSHLFLPMINIFLSYSRVFLYFGRKIKKREFFISSKILALIIKNNNMVSEKCFVKVE